MNPLVSIVILNWNGRRYLEQFLPSVLSSTYSNYKIAVIDNASTDDSVSFLKKNYPDVRIISLLRNYGFAKGYNEGLKQVESDYYILLNSDVEVEKGWIEPLVALMEADRKIAACQPKVLQFHNRKMFEYAGAAGGWLDYLGYAFAKGRIFDVCENDEGQYDQAEPIFWASGAAMFVKASVYHEMHGLDEYFFAHQEEIDLCWRIQLAGHTIFSCPQSVVYHVGGGTLPKGNSKKVFLNFRNNLVMMAKNLPAGEAFWKIAYRFILDGISAIKSLFAGQGTYFIAVLMAHFAFLHWLFFVRKKKRSNKRRRLQGYFGKSVVWSHFVLGKKRFTEIVLKEN
ncbi:MAG: glycosyltransferase family 2 protein [Chitinophagaceae bacterium]|nr:glycosyltransferase family 2 protein [Chitinophagaceae bacterium]